MGTLFRAVRTLCVLALAFGAAGAAQAMPEFAAREGKACVYCHKSPVGGERAYRGVFYKQNGLSFAGFDDAAEAKKAGVEIGPEPTPPPKSWTAPKKAEGTSGEGGKTGEGPTTGQAAEGTNGEGAVKVAQGDAPKMPKSTLTIAQATAKVKTAEAAYKKNPKGKERIQAYAEAVAQLGRATMLDAKLPPMRKYPEALRLYRRALKLDPSNKTALADKKLIEDVYRSMGRPVPTS